LREIVTRGSTIPSFVERRREIKVKDVKEKGGIGEGQEGTGGGERRRRRRKEEEVKDEEVRSTDLNNRDDDSLPRMARREEDSNISIDEKEEGRKEKERRGGGKDTRHHCRLYKNSQKNTLSMSVWVGAPRQPRGQVEFDKSRR